MCVFFALYVVVFCIFVSKKRGREKKCAGILRCVFINRTKTSCWILFWFHLYGCRHMVYVCKSRSPTIIVTVNEYRVYFVILLLYVLFFAYANKCSLFRSSSFPFATHISGAHNTPKFRNILTKPAIHKMAHKNTHSLTFTLNIKRFYANNTHTHTQNYRSWNWKSKQNTKSQIPSFNSLKA